MKLHVDANGCQGHTQCAFIAPELFRVREEDGHAEVILEQVPPELEVNARLAVESCPERAISLQE